MYKLEITSIYCNQKGGDASHDDVMILVQTDASPPSRFPIFSSQGGVHQVEYHLHAILQY